ncbi:hypothetical protein Nepgr_011744 [Nepenthes gracilis]|uniref:HhH-GPD domain-containing protein n=1 Tax=Nepenthes gracilis TaxID=150966 RepID=A0AAD3SEN3_NEPGR|nr:hypothetical protein Nepgr_011744 [Nepenthes gracilis]
MPDDPLAEGANLSFSELLGMAWTLSSPSICGIPPGNRSATLASLISPYEENRLCSSSMTSMVGNPGLLPQSSQQIICTPEWQHCGIPQPYGSFYDLDLSPNTHNSSSDGNKSVVVPVTPDHCRRLENNVSSERSLCVAQTAKERNREQENQVAATRADLQNKEETTPGSNILPGTVSTLVENHDPDKGSNNGNEMSKMSQQKPRRKKHRPKVVTEGKPKRVSNPRTRKPRMPKLTDPEETPRVKRKYVRRNKINLPSTTPPAETAAVFNPNGQDHAVKSCRKALNFDSDGQARESDSFQRQTCDSLSEPPANDRFPRNIQSKQSVCRGKGQEMMMETTQAGTAETVSRTMNQMQDKYKVLPQVESPSPSYLTKSIPSQEKVKAIPEYESNTNSHSQAADSSMEEYGGGKIPRADSLWTQSSNSSTCASTNNEVQTWGSKRDYSSMVDTAYENANHLNTTHGAFCSQNHLFVEDGSINLMGNILFPEICKKKRTEKVQRPNNTSCESSSATESDDFTQITSRPNCLRGIPTASKYYCIPAPQFDTGASLNALAEAAGRIAGNHVQFIHAWTDIEKSKKRRRSKGSTHVRALGSLAGEHKEQPTFCGKQAVKCARRKKTVDISGNHHACMEAIAADNLGAQTKKKRSRKRTPAVSSFQSNVGAMNAQHAPIFYINHQLIQNSAGPFPALPWTDVTSVDTITDKLQQLDIARESTIVAFPEQNALIPYHMNRQDKASITQGENALVVYRKDGTIVPFEGSFYPIKKRIPRAKVDLDEETNRVWNLLLENINNKGIDGTDEEKVKWWEEERRVFHGRVESFVARMRLVQGDRRFSPWKGSVVDSVIGVFLTQNVSDHLSSSAFMSLAARFPLKSRSKLQAHTVETSALGAEPENPTLNLEGIETWTGKMVDEPVCDRSSRTLHDVDHGEEKEVANSKELLGRSPCAFSPKDNVCAHINSCESSHKMTHESTAQGANGHIIDTETASISGDTRTVDDITSSQHSMLSSQTSVCSPSAPTAGRLGSCSESNSEADDLSSSSNPSCFNCCTSFMELLKRAETPMLHEGYIHQSTHASSYQKHTNNQQWKEHENQGRRALTSEFLKSSLETPNLSSDDQLQQRTDVQLQDANCYEIVDEESRSDNYATKDDNCTTEQSELTTESTNQFSLQEKVLERIQKPISSAENVCSCYVLEGERMVMQPHRQMRNQQNISASPAQGQESLLQKEISFPSQATLGVTESNKPFSDKKSHGHEDAKINLGDDYASTIVNRDAGKQKKGRVGKGRKTATDWENLRKEAQINSRNRERTANTMDSLDYEAVRCADDSEIADTIKERGMNNKLAERIKDFLNRLVSEHGSLDLEWLRDVPPDKAKEYLLSIRGLGLKSVECVRLLTLRHLAFPVDTNVGRIAVRLGWVPLQPLPESLQLHLLELYPVLESIQKYLWPRLCKLDQRTLYELHYHMITFGKVFCTKRQPNCNACPLRGECRHFASAFASARLALPGPEERSIVTSTQCGVTHQDTLVTINPLALPLPQANQHLEAKLGITNCEPIIEVPASPEPEQMQTLEYDIEDTAFEDPDEIPTIKLNLEQFTRTLHNYMQTNMELQQGDMSKALVTLTAEAASIPTPKLKNVSQLRTEHHVYELPDTHPVLDGLDKREPDDPCSYLLAIWTPGETANSIQPPEKRCSSQEPGELCDDETCFNCNSHREANSQIVRGTLLIPCRTAMRGSFPLNGTYFQVNEVFADHDSSLNPIAVRRDWLWNLPRRTVYFGTSIPTIFRGLSTEGIQHCFWKGYVCVRGFDQKTRAPRPLIARLHFPASKITKAKGKANDRDDTTL